MFKIIIWSGHHSSEIKQLITETYHSSDCMLILCPPRIKDLDPWLNYLPSGMVEFRGDFQGQKSFLHTSSITYPEPPSFGLFSTGTVDNAKLILYSKKNFKASIEGIFSFFKELNIKSIFSYPQPYHIFGLALGYLTALINKWELFYPEGTYSKEAHQAWLKCGEENGEKLLTLGTPTHFLDAMSFCKDHALVPASSLTSIVGGAKVEKKLWHSLQTELKISKPSIGYGCSETSPGVAHLPPGLAPLEDGDLGTLLPNGQLRDVGNSFMYQGDNVCLAMIQNGEIIFPKGEYLLSDLLSQDERGHYHFRSRVGLVLNRGGEKFNLEEIETIIKTHFHCRSIAMAVEDPRLGQELGILFIGNSELEEQIVQRLNQIFGRTFSAQLIMSTNELPVNANAKYDRTQAREILKTRNQ